TAEGGTRAHRCPGRARARRTSGRRDRELSVHPARKAGIETGRTGPRQTSRRTLQRRLSKFYCYQHLAACRLSRHFEPDGRFRRLENRRPPLRDSRPCRLTFIDLTKFEHTAAVAYRPFTLRITRSTATVIRSSMSGVNRPGNTEKRNASPPS